jgi:hypothetical protein
MQRKRQKITNGGKLLWFLNVLYFKKIQYGFYQLPVKICHSISQTRHIIIVACREAFTVYLCKGNKNFMGLKLSGDDGNLEQKIVYSK